MNISFHPRRRLLSSARLGIALATSVALFVGCTTMRPVSSADLPRLTSLVAVNDTVTCTLRDGSTRTLKVAAVEPDALVGDNHQRVLVADITHAEIERTDTTKTVLLVLGIAAGIAAVAAGGGGGGMGGGGY